MEKKKKNVEKKEVIDSLEIMTLKSEIEELTEMKDKALRSRSYQMYDFIKALKVQKDLELEKLTIKNIK